MPKRRKSNLGRYTAVARRVAIYRRNKAEQERQLSLAYDRASYAAGNATKHRYNPLVQSRDIKAVSERPSVTKDVCDTLRLECSVDVKVEVVVEGEEYVLISTLNSRPQGINQECLEGLKEECSRRIKQEKS